MNGPDTDIHHPDNSLLGSVLAIAVLTVFSHVLGATIWTHALWGSHFYAFFPPIVLSATTSGLFIAFVVVFYRRRQMTLWNGPKWFESRPVATTAIVAIAAAIPMWTLRSGNTYLGDGTILINSVADGQSFHPREPLTMAFQQWIYQAAAGLPGPSGRTPDLVALDAIAVGSVIAGGLFVVVAAALAREIVRLGSPDGSSDTVSQYLVLLLICTQGYMQLFFGYVENYSLYALTVAVYLWICLRCARRQGALLIPAMVLAIGIAVHIAFVILLPSFLVLAFIAMTRADSRIPAIRDLAIFVVLLTGLHFAFGAWQPGYSLLDTLLEAMGFAVSREHERVAIFSAVHLRDFFNEQTLIGPLGIFLALAAAIAFLSRRRRMQSGTIYLAVAGLGYLAAAWLAGDSNLGYARDWDVWAPAGIVFTVVGLGLSFAVGRSARSLRPALLCALFLSLYHTVPWIVVNASAERGLDRLKTLPLGLGRTEVLVSQWYRSHGRDSERVEWLHKAIDVNPSNNNAHYLLGIYYVERGNPSEASVAFQRAVELRPDKILFRQLLVDVLIQLDRHADALPHIEFELTKDPGNVSRWMYYGEILRGAGRDADAVIVFDRILPEYVRLVETAPDDYAANLAAGWLLYNLSRYEESIEYLDAASRIQSGSADSVCLLGYALLQSGRTGEASVAFARCLAISPDRADRTDIERWIQADSLR